MIYEERKKIQKWDKLRRFNIAERTLEIKNRK